MAKVTVVTPSKTVPCELPPGFSGRAKTAAYVAGTSDPLHLLIHTLGPGEDLRIGPRSVDCLAYVWTGEVKAGGRSLTSGSSLVVERGATVNFTGGEGSSQILTFAAANPEVEPRAGGHVHLLPAERVLRITGMIEGVNGGMHFDSACPTCELWLHESEFTPAFLTPENETRGAHCHDRDEIIFITRGQAKLGNQLHGSGTALAIHAGTMYTFNPGPNGLTFINFRAGRPGENRRADGRSGNEADGWQRQLGGKRPDYLEPV